MSERNKKRCIALLPSGPHFELLFEEVFELAIRKTGLVSSRLYWNAFSPTPIHIFVDEIEQAEALVADVSVHTDEIWLAVGCAVALGKPLCLISSTMEATVPLGIQYLPHISYPSSLAQARTGSSATERESQRNAPQHAPVHDFSAPDKIRAVLLSSSCPVSEAIDINLSSRPERSEVESLP